MTYKKDEWVEYLSGKKYKKGIFLKERFDKFLIQTDMGVLLIDKKKVKKK